MKPIQIEHNINEQLSLITTVVDEEDDDHDDEYSDMVNDKKIEEEECSDSYGGKMISTKTINSLMMTVSDAVINTGTSINLRKINND